MKIKSSIIALMIVLLCTEVFLGIGHCVVSKEANLHRKFGPWLWNKLPQLETKALDKYVSVIIRLANAGRKTELVESLKTSVNVKSIRPLEVLPMILAKVKASYLQNLAAHPLIARVSDGQAETRAFLNTAVPTVNADVARETYDVNGSGITIAVLDSGIDETHPDLDDLDDDPSTNDPKVLYEISFAYTDFDETELEDPEDYYGHGTYCAGIAAGTGFASNRTYVGAAPGANLVNVKVLNHAGNGLNSWIIAGIDWCIANKEIYNIRILSMSLGIIYREPYDDGTSDICVAADNAVANGLVVCVAEGNTDLVDLEPYSPPYRVGSYFAVRPPASPAAAFNVISVGGSDDKGTSTIGDDTMWMENVSLLKLPPRFFLLIASRAGPTGDDRTKPDVVAPAKDVTSCNSKRETSGRYYVTHSGTSAATPLVAGSIALLLEKCPELGPADVKDTLKSTTELNSEFANAYNGYTYGAENIRGTGIVNISKAVSTHYPPLTVLAKDRNGNPLTTGDVYIDDILIGYTGSTFHVKKGSHTVFINDFWEEGTTGYRYFFDHWNDGWTNNPRTIEVLEETTITAHFIKRWCPGDVDGSGIVDLYDAIIASICFGSVRGDSKWDSRVDLHRDEMIDMRDIAIVSQNLGNVYKFELTINAEDQRGHSAYPMVFIDCEYVGYAGSTFDIWIGTHEIYVESIFWVQSGSGSGGWMYEFDHWIEDGSTEDPRSLYIDSDRTMTAYYIRTRWEGPIPK